MSSPIPKKAKSKEAQSMSFYGAIAEIMNGARVTRLEWDNKAHYCFIKDGILSYHKAGEPDSTIHYWIINDGDILGVDWISIDEKN